MQLIPCLATYKEGSVLGVRRTALQRNTGIEYRYSARLPFARVVEVETGFQMSPSLLHSKSNVLFVRKAEAQVALS